jgi:phosphoribosylanthranilate isomerase
MKIKVCGLNDAGNLAAVAALRPDFAGFVFHRPSPRYAGKLDPAAMTALSDDTLRVGVFVNVGEGCLFDIAERYALDFLQLHGNESPDFCARAAERLPVIKAFGIDSESDFDAARDYESACKYFLFDTKSVLRGGSGRKFDHRLLDAYRGNTPFFLSGGIAPDDAEELARPIHPLCAAIDVNSRFETLPGVKDAAKVRAFMETIRNNRKQSETIKNNSIKR